MQSNFYHILGKPLRLFFIIEHKQKEELKFDFPLLLYHKLPAAPLYLTIAASLHHHHASHLSPPSEAPIVYISTGQLLPCRCYPCNYCCPGFYLLLLATSGATTQHLRQPIGAPAPLGQPPCTNEPQKHSHDHDYKK